jgi:uncharacterized membrane protein HdeD (DUF308 family)
MPAASAILSIVAGILALARRDDPAAVLAIIAGVTGAVGVIATGRAGKVRDDQLRFWIEAIGDTQNHIREGFGS